MHIHDRRNAKLERGDFTVDAFSYESETDVEADDGVRGLFVGNIMVMVLGILVLEDDSLFLRDARNQR